MLMLLPSELPMFAPISFAASISIEPGMKMPACPSLSYTSSSTGMMLPPCSSEVMPMPSLSPCNRAAPTRSVFRGMTRPDTRIGSNSRSFTVCPSVMVWSPCTQAAMVFFSEASAVPMAVWKP